MKHPISLFLLTLACAAMIIGCSKSKDDPKESDGNTENQETQSPAIPEGALNGVFSVGEGKKVVFSKGNLQYNAVLGEHVRADGTKAPGMWQLAEEQWECLKEDNAKASDSYDGWIDLFCFGADGWKGGVKEYQPYSKNYQLNNFILGNDVKAGLTGEYAYADWGMYNAISNAGNKPGLWRTLTSAEWIYLFTERPNARELFSKACVNGINGYILLPDDWIPISGLEVKVSPSTYAINSFTANEWNIMQTFGAVFLPAAGYRNGTLMAYDNQAGLYWSSTADDYTYIYAIVFSEFHLFEQGGSHRSFAISVRLVHDIE